MARVEQPGAHDRRQTDRAGTDDGDDVAGPDLTVEHAHLVARREDVGEHQQLLVAHTVRSEVGRRVGERNADVLGLRAVDLVTEDPASATEALPVHAFAAVAAGAAGGDARHQHAIAGLAGLDARPDRLDRADRLVAEDPPGRDRWDITLENVQVGAADRHRIDANDGVGVIDNVGFGTSSHVLSTWSVIDDCVHLESPSPVVVRRCSRWIRRYGRGAEAGRAIRPISSLRASPRPTGASTIDPPDGAHLRHGHGSAVVGHASRPERAGLRRSDQP